MTDSERDPQSTEKPGGPPPDEGLAYDPQMTDTDEANIPPESDADPDSSGSTDRSSDGGPAEGGD